MRPIFLLKQQFKLALARFCVKTSGNVGLSLALTLPALAVAGGLAVDYSRMTKVKTALQAAVDSAVLTVAQSTTNSQADRNLIAVNAVGAGFTFKSDVTGLNVVETEPSSGVFDVTASAVVKTSLLKFAGIQSANIHAFAEAQSSSGVNAPLEVALALDNTGSMKTDISQVIVSANTLATQMFAADPTGTKVRLSVVPYTGVVNAGAQKFPLSYIDVAGMGYLNSFHFKYAADGWQPGCTPSNWHGTTPGGGGGGGSVGASSSGDRTELIDVLAPVATVAQALFGISPALADVTPNTQKSTMTYYGNGGMQVPTGFDSYNDLGCMIFTNPGGGYGQMSTYDLFHRINGGPAWKGCVMARGTKAELTGNTMYVADDYDVSDVPPDPSNPETQFVPYFAPDEPDSYWDQAQLTTPGAYPPPEGQGYHNNYMSDGTQPAGWSFLMGGWYAGKDYTTQSDWLRAFSLIKYDYVTKPAIIKETAPDSYGPNAYCPDELLRLTNNKSAVTNKINGMNYWLGGGTVISEGLMWAWRTLSPNAPYADGAAYNKTTKAIVLMTDGVNGLAANGEDPVSDFSAYDYLLWRLGATSFDSLTTALDARTLLACSNIKATGIKIYTVLFNHSNTLSAAQQAHSLGLLQTCASTPAGALLATDQNSLTAAFGVIGSQSCLPGRFIWRNSAALERGCAADAFARRDVTFHLEFAANCIM